MHLGRGTGEALTQECGFFPIAVNEMHLGTGLFRQRDGEDESGKSGTRAQISPDSGVGGKIEQLE